MLCTLSGVKGYKPDADKPIPVQAPNVTAADGTQLVAATDFTFTPTTVNGEGSKTLNVSRSKPPYSGWQELHLLCRRLSRTYSSIDHADSKTLTAPKGIELRKGNSLTINGDTDDTGKLEISGCANRKSAIGALEPGMLTVNGGTINVNTNVGTITINGGQLTDAAGTPDAAGIGMRAQTQKSNPNSSGTLTLGSTRSTRFVYTSAYTNNVGSKLTTISFADGKTFVAQGEDAVATADNISRQKIVPVISLDDKRCNNELLHEYHENQIAVQLGPPHTLCRRRLEHHLSALQH